MAKFLDAMSISTTDLYPHCSRYINVLKMYMCNCVCTVLTKKTWILVLVDMAITPLKSIGMGKSWCVS